MEPEDLLSNFRPLMNMRKRGLIAFGKMHAHFVNPKARSRVVKCSRHLGVWHLFILFWQLLLPLLFVLLTREVKCAVLDRLAANYHLPEGEKEERLRSFTRKARIPSKGTTRKEQLENGPRKKSTLLTLNNKRHEIID